MAPVEWKTIEGEKWFKLNSQFDKFKYFYGHWVSIILFVVVIISVIWVGVYIYQNKVAFFENPVVFGIKQMEETNEGNISCSCFITGGRKSGLDFKLDNKGIHPARIRSVKTWDPSFDFDSTTFANISIISTG